MFREILSELIEGLRHSTTIFLLPLRLRCSQYSKVKKGYCTVDAFLRRGIKISATYIKHRGILQVRVLHSRPA